MATTTHKLNARRVETETKPGMYSDGDGLYLQVTGADAKSWLFRYTLRGKQRWLGLGSARASNGGLSLSEARHARDDARAQVRRGVDPVVQRREEAKARRLAETRTITFEAAAFQYLAAHRASWDNAKHASQWDATLRTYAYPTMGALSVAEIDTQIVLGVLQPIWSDKPETAARLRGRIERVLDWATSAGFREGVNPARWRGHLENLLAARSKVATVKHHAAMPYLEIGAFMAKLHEREGVAPLALAFTILTASRTSEVLGMQWAEIDFAEAVWTIPAERMKARRPHRVPLSKPALAVLQKIQVHTRQHRHVFANLTRGRPLSNMAMLKQLERMGLPDLTVHGFRSTFKDWARDRTAYPNELSEAALAHVIGDKTERAYARGDMFEKRRRMMDDWAAWCSAPAVVAEVADLSAFRASAAV